MIKSSASCISTERDLKENLKRCNQIIRNSMVRKYLYNYLKSIYKTLLIIVISEFITFCNIICI